MIHVDTFIKTLLQTVCVFALSQVHRTRVFLQLPPAFLVEAQVILYATTIEPRAGASGGLLSKCVEAYVYQRALAAFVDPDALQAILAHDIVGRPQDAAIFNL